MERVANQLTEDSFLDGLTPRQHPYWFSLQRRRHIGVRIDSSGNKAWMARYLRKNGRYRQRQLCLVAPFHSEGLSFSEARELATDWFNSASVALDASEAAPLGPTIEPNFCPIGEKYSVGHALFDYAERLRIVSTLGSRHNVVNSINYYLTSTVSSTLVEDFTGKELEKLAIHVLCTPPKKGTVVAKPKVPISSLSNEQLRLRKARLNTLISILRVAFRLAWENGRIETERPWRCLRAYPVARRPRTLFLDREECSRLLAVCGPPLRKLVLGALYTGCRVGELGNLRVGDVASGGYGVSVAPFKRGPARFVFLPEEGMRFFLDACRGRNASEHIFLSERGIPWVRQHRHLFKKAVSAAGLPKEFVFHGLRHTYASQLVCAGVSLEVIARQLGHADTRTVADTYGHLAERIRESEVRRAFAPICDEFSDEAVRECRRLDAKFDSLRASSLRGYPFTADYPRKPRRYTTSGSGELHRLLIQFE